MKKNADYLILEDGKKVRVLFSMNAVEQFTRESGIEITDLTQIKADVSVFRKLAHICVQEGEAADGHKFELDEISFGRLMNIPSMTQFSAIIAKQSAGVQKKTATSAGGGGRGSRPGGSLEIHILLYAEVRPGGAAAQTG